MNGYIQELNHNAYGGYNDWRLPTLEEAMSLIDPEKNANGLYIDPIFDTKQEWIWTADTKDNIYTWVVSFIEGKCGYNFVDYFSYVRAVRHYKESIEQAKIFSSQHIFRTRPQSNLSGKEVKFMLVENGFFDSAWNKHSYGFMNKFRVSKNGYLIFDSTSALLWQRSGSANDMTYKEAQVYVGALNREKFQEYDDWRLPTLEEVMTLIEPQKENEELHINGEFDKEQESLWTSDTESARRAWGVSLGDGFCSAISINLKLRVRAVR
jgi:hypothetical protein